QLLIEIGFGPYLEAPSNLEEGKLSSRRHNALWLSPPPLAALEPGIVERSSFPSYIHSMCVTFFHIVSTGKPPAVATRPSIVAAAPSMQEPPRLASSHGEIGTAHRSRSLSNWNCTEKFLRDRIGNFRSD
ncbi:hypothetical protein PIB30_105388, partial [Stylosanthes scabra]|nr:hypothetical protein [Stylosanthes scabra]